MTTLTNMPSPVCDFAATAIGEIGTNARPALPTLIAVLRNTNALAVPAAIALGQMKLEPELVVPALTNGLLSRDARTRAKAAQALGEFGQKARGAVPALVKLLNDSDSTVRVCAMDALMRVDRDVFE
jgi:HEAT repeat protein